LGQSFTIYMTRDDGLGAQPWTGLAFETDHPSEVVAAVAGASVYDVLIDLAKAIDKAAVPA
jgi:hypothetical protein